MDKVAHQSDMFSNGSELTINEESLAISLLLSESSTTILLICVYADYTSLLYIILTTKYTTK